MDGIFSLTELLPLEMDYTVRSLASELAVWQQIVATVDRLLVNREAGSLLARIADLPVRRSRATRSLGTYVSRAGEPLCIRLQFVLEPELLKETFLHELAHVCDHLSNQAGQPYRRAHGPGWQRWATALGITGETRTESETLSRLYRARLKPVAVCRRCRVELKRIRRLSRRRTYIHQSCGGRLDPL